MNFPRYPEYKDSGVAWLGKVPSHWTTQRCRFLFEIKKRIAGEEGHDILSITQQGIRVKDIDSNDGQLSQDYSKYQLVYPGDFAMNHMDLLTGYVDVSAVPGVTSPDYRVFSLRDEQEGVAAYFLYVFQNAYKQRILYAYGQGSSQLGRWRLPTDQFNDFSLPCPSPSEQVAIAAFLDRETGKIDVLVGEQEKLIELLKEKRQAVISHAVTKGLEPSVPMKDSGIEWLGEVPAHWRVRRVKDVANLESGHTPSKTIPEYWENCDINWVSLNDSKKLASSDYIFETAFKISELGMANSSARLLPAGAVVFTRDATIGLSAITMSEMAVSQHLIAWCPSGNIDARYLLRVVDAMREFLDSFTFGATIKTIGMADIKRLVTPLPPLSEQEAIIDFLSQQVATVDALIETSQRAIDLLKERRSSLISAAVTGKIDVRGLVGEEAA